MVPWGSVRVASCSRNFFFLFQLRKVWINNVKFQLNAQYRISFFPPQMTDIISSTVIPFHTHTIQHVGICETLTTYVSVRPSVIQKIFIRVSSPLVRHKVSYNRDTKITVIHINTTDNYMLHAKSLQHIRQTKKKNAFLKLPCSVESQFWITFFCITKIKVNMTRVDRELTATLPN